MKIEKYIKDKQNKYKVYIDGEEHVLYDDVIIKYQLLMKSEIDKSTFDEMIKVNDEMKSYYDSIKYITKKLRSKKEIEEYLKKKEISNDIIKKTIKRLEDNNFLNEDIYIKCYISDQINLTNNGKNKIKKNLIKLGLEEDKINDKLNEIDYSIWNDKINNYIEKKIKTNHTSSATMLKMKITNDLVNLGYDKSDVTSILSNYDIIDNDVFKKELEKATRTLSEKYSGYELERKIKEKLYRKGFKLNTEVMEDYYEE